MTMTAIGPLAMQISRACCVLAVLSLASPGFADNPTPEQLERIVHDYVAAFNARDLDAMLDRVAEDVQWLSVEGDQVSTVTGSRDELASSLASYFESCSSCKSRLAGVTASASRVSALEVASFETASGRRSMQSVSVYEFSGHLISRVYYFPAEDIP